MTIITIKESIDLKKTSFNNIYELMVELSKYISTQQNTTNQETSKAISSKKSNAPLLECVNSDEYKNDKGEVYNSMEALVGSLQKYKK